MAVNTVGTDSFSSVLVALFLEVSDEYEISFLGKAAIWNSFKTISIDFCWPPFLHLLVADCELVCHERNQD